MRQQATRPPAVLTKAGIELGDLDANRSVALLLAVHGHRLGGALIVSPHDPMAAEHWVNQISQWRSVLELPSAVHRVPVYTGLDQMLGGSDIFDTLLSKKTVTRSGLLARSDGALLLLPYAELQQADSLRSVCHAMDNFAAEKHGVDKHAAEGSMTGSDVETKVCVMAVTGSDNISDALDGDHAVENALLERLAFGLQLSEVSSSNCVDLSDTHLVEAMRYTSWHWQQVTLLESQIEQLCLVAKSLGIDSIRPAIQCATVARSVAAFAHRSAVSDDDLDVAMAMCFAWRAVSMAPPEQQQEEQQKDQRPDQQPEPPEESPDESRKSPDEQPHDHTRQPPESKDSSAKTPEQFDDIEPVVLPSQLLSALQSTGDINSRQFNSGKGGKARRSAQRGRIIGTQRYRSGQGQKINILATLQQAAPWQAHRQHANTHRDQSATRPLIEPQDVRVSKFKQPTQALVIFAVDASGSAAAQRLAEAKGAVELLLSQCYVRRDQVALIVFQGASARLALSPTRSLVTARRELTQLPAGGGTPLASAIVMAQQVASEAKRCGNSPLLCLLTDGKANVDRDGIGGRRRALAQTLEAAEQLRQAQVKSLTIDIAARGATAAKELAEALGGDYIALPRADAHRITNAVNSVMPPKRRSTREDAA